MCGASATRVTVSRTRRASGLQPAQWHRHYDNHSGSCEHGCRYVEVTERVTIAAEDGGQLTGAGGGEADRQTVSPAAEDGGADSKHWFTTSFLQPLPHLVTP